MIRPRACGSVGSGRGSRRGAWARYNVLGEEMLDADDFGRSQGTVRGAVFTILEADAFDMVAEAKLHGCSVWQRGCRYVGRELAESATSLSKATLPDCIDGRVSHGRLARR